MVKWRPSFSSHNKEELNEFWEVFGKVVEEAISLEPLYCQNSNDPKAFEHYVQRKNYLSKNKISSIKSKISPKFEKYKLGQQEIDLIGMLTTYNGRKHIAVLGHRGVGKSSFINYVGWAIQTSGVNKGSYFINIDCRAIREADRYTNLAQLFFDAIANMEVNGFSKSVISKAKKILSDRDIDKIPSAISFLNLNLPPEDSEKIVIIFDNLDQLNYELISLFTNISKQISVATQFPTIVCIRPNSMQYLAVNGSSRAMFGFRLNLTPPDFELWFKVLGDRIVKTFIKQQLNSDITYRIYNRKVTAQNLKEFFFRTSRFLRNRVADDDVFKLMETISSEDTRHLVFLIKFLMSHHEFPDDYLFLQKEIYEKLHHPFHYLLKAENHIYKSNNVIPNLLYIEFNNEESYLLSYIVLCLIANRVNIYKDIVSCIELIGCTENLLRSCLDVLMQSILIRGTTAVSINKVCNPEAFYLTASGQYYLESFINMPDYITNVITDIKGNHSALSASCLQVKSDDIFKIKLADIVDSLEECINNVLDCEKSVFTSLTSNPQSQSLYNLTLAVKNFGFLSEQLIKSHYALCSRINEKNAKLSATMKHFADEKSTELDRFKSHRFVELLNKCSNDLAFKQCELDFNFQSVRVKLVLDNGLCTTNLKVCIEPGEFLRKDRFYLVSVSATDAAEQIYYASRSINHINIDNKFSQHLFGYENYPCLNIPYESACNKSLYKVKLTEVLSSKVDALQSNVAIISTHLYQNKLEIVLSIVGGDDCSEYIIGSVSDFNSLMNSVRIKVAKVNSVSGNGNLSVDLLDKIGSALSKEILSSEGEDLLLSHLKTTELAIFCINEELVEIPWEWIRPRPKKGSETKSLGEAWHIYRNILSIRNHCKLDLNSINFDLNISQYKVVGKGSNSNAPSSTKEIYKVFEHNSFVHLIGHYDKENSMMKIGESSHSESKSTLISLDIDDIDTYGFYGKNKVIILSSCGLSLQKSDDNLAFKLSERNGCEVWSPLITIPTDYATSLDKRIHASIEKEHVMDVFTAWNALMNIDAGLFKRVYTRYLILE